MAEMNGSYEEGKACIPVSTTDVSIKQGKHQNSESEAPAKKKAEDFIFGKLIGEGSYSSVFLAKEVKTDREYAIKVLEKRHIIKENKQQYVMREKEVFSKLNHPFFVSLYFTFQDAQRLYFGLSYARGGELLTYLNKLGCFDDKCTQFYSAEIVSALEHMHSLGIIHRDLKPENILLNEQMHIQITDFGSAKILDDGRSNEAPVKQRRNSFVGTAQYVSPEVLTSKSSAYSSSDLWALGCIIYQLVSGQLPFWGGHEYQVFQKIMKVEYEYPEGFCTKTRKLVEQLLVLDPTKRLGCKECGGYKPLKKDAFFEGIDWDNLPEQTPPELLPYLPAIDEKSENLWSKYKPGFDARQLSVLVDGDFHQEKGEKENWLEDTERKNKLAKQAQENCYHKFVENNLIIKQGFVDKRKGLFARRRMLLLTEGPHLFYVDAAAMVLKGQIPWSDKLWPEVKNFKTFFIHTPNRTYYLEDPAGYALSWRDSIEELWKHYYGERTEIPQKDSSKSRKS